MSLRAWRIALAGYFVVLAVISGLAYAHGLSSVILELPHADKLLHFGLLGGASFLARKATDDERAAGVPGGPLAVGLCSVIDECAQAFFPTRTFSLADLAANIAGVVVFALLAGPRKNAGGEGEGRKL
ncbi:VanZ family protein [Polyangium aurulentum]|uniref:VanZ family protein n=1 Tax=Polyangium aurulentum TaxID=2567896 RepID=UPI00146D01A6|nr:VanZ family protein [Polyangium aurulentum]UQA60166.1 VanZ family protein [Polyangium aurulentum]